MHASVNTTIIGSDNQMAWGLFGAKPFSEPMLVHVHVYGLLVPWEQVSVKYEPK